LAFLYSTLRGGASRTGTSESPGEFDRHSENGATERTDTDQRGTFHRPEEQEAD
jgi:hypothetical protein